MKKIFISIIATVGIFCMSFTLVNLENNVYAAQVVSQDELLAYWDMDDGSGSTATELMKKVAGRDLKVVGNASWVDGKNGKAFNFDGNTVLAMDGAKVIRTENLTVSLWAKIDSFPESDTGANLFMANSDLAALDRGAFDFGFFGAGLKSYVVNNFAGGTGDGVSHGVNIEDQIKGKWQHFAVVYNQDEGAEYAKLYLNGTEVKSAKLTSILGLEIKLGYPRTASYKKCDFNIGGYVDTAGKVIRSIDGAMDDIAIYGRVLTLAEIKLLASGVRPDAQAQATTAPTATPTGQPTQGQNTPTPGQNTPTPGNATPTMAPSSNDTSLGESSDESSDVSDVESSDTSGGSSKVSDPISQETPTDSSSEESDSDDNGKDEQGNTLLIVILSIIGAAGIGALIYYLIKKTKK